MSTMDDQNKKRTVTTPAEPDEMGSAKETTTVRGKNEPQSVRRSG